MASSEKMRILVYSLFFVAVIWLGVFYRPANFRSRPAAQNAGVPARESSCSTRAEPSCSS